MKYNAELFQKNVSYAGEDSASLSRKLGTTQSTMFRHVHCASPSVRLLVDVCNVCRIDIYRLFEDDVVASAEQITVSADAWRNVEFHPECITGLSRFRNPELVRVKDLIDLCDGGGVDFRKVIVHDVRREVSVMTGKAGCVKFNMALFGVLPAILGICKTEIGTRIGHSNRVYHKAMQIMDVQISTLVEICNTWHIPVSLFFVDGDGTVPSVVVDESLPVQGVYTSRLREFYGPSKGKTYEEFRDMLGYSQSYMVRVLSNRAAMKASELCRISAILGVHPMYFLEDPAEHSESVDKASVDATIRHFEKQAQRESAEVARLRSEIAHLQAVIELKKKGG